MKRFAAGLALVLIAFGSPVSASDLPAWVSGKPALASGWCGLATVEPNHHISLAYGGYLHVVKDAWVSGITFGQLGGDLKLSLDGHVLGHIVGGDITGNSNPSLILERGLLYLQGNIILFGGGKLTVKDGAVIALRLNKDPERPAAIGAKGGVVFEGEPRISVEFAEDADRTALMEAQLDILSWDTRILNDGEVKLYVIGEEDPAGTVTHDGILKFNH